MRLMNFNYVACIWSAAFMGSLFCTPRSSWHLLLTLSFRLHMQVLRRVRKASRLHASSALPWLTRSFRGPIWKHPICVLLEGNCIPHCLWVSVLFTLAGPSISIRTLPHLKGCIYLMSIIVRAKVCISLNSWDRNKWSYKKHRSLKEGIKSPEAVRPEMHA